MKVKVLREMKNEFVDFSNTEIAFSHKRDHELRWTGLLFKWMNKRWWVKLSGALAIWSIRWHLPLARTIIKKTIFPQFIGGETLLDCQSVIEKLYRLNTYTVLDYGAEGLTSEDDLNEAKNQFIKAVEFASIHESIPFVSIKVSALSRNELLEKIQTRTTQTDREQEHFKNVVKRVDDICSKAHQLGIKIFIDAEESWIQAPIDELVIEMMEKYNRERVTVYNTFQFYRHDRYDFLIKSYEDACRKGYLLGAKLVRGAYMEKERERALEKGYPSPIQPDRDSTDRDFNRAIEFCVDHFEEIGSCTATHNMRSCLFQAELIGNRKLPRNHPHLNFSQLYGMSDNITFNLAANNFNVSKYVPYGPVHNIIPYLIRRAEENSSVGGEFSREYQLLRIELNRRMSSKKIV